MKVLKDAKKVAYGVANESVPADGCLSVSEALERAATRTPGVDMREGTILHGLIREVEELERVVVDLTNDRTVAEADAFDRLDFFAALADRLGCGTDGIDPEGPASPSFLGVLRRLDKIKAELVETTRVPEHWAWSAVLGNLQAVNALVLLVAEEAGTTEEPNVTTFWTETLKAAQRMREAPTKAALAVASYVGDMNKALGIEEAQPWRHITARVRGLCAMLDGAVGYIGSLEHALDVIVSGEAEAVGVECPVVDILVTETSDVTRLRALQRTNGGQEIVFGEMGVLSHAEFSQVVIDVAIEVWSRLPKAILRLKF